MNLLQKISYEISWWFTNRKLTKVFTEMSTMSVREIEARCARTGMPGIEHVVPTLVQIAEAVRTGHGDFESLAKEFLNGVDKAIAVAEAKIAIQKIQDEGGAIISPLNLEAA